MHALAAALTLVGAAGLAFALSGLLAGPSTEAAGDDPMLFSVGDVPAPLEAQSTPGSAFGAPALPEGVNNQEIAGAGAGDFTRGRLHNTATPTPSPVPTAGSSQNGVRESQQSIAFEPTDIRIPKIDVAAKIVPVGTTSDGAMEAPQRYSEIGWWSPGARPGDLGRSVLAGHVDSPWGAAVFVNLDELEPGDEIIVGNGLAELRFIVRGAAVYRADAAPVEQIFGRSSERELVLITCGGWFDRSTASYLHRHVVFAVLADDSAESPGAHAGS